MKILENKPMNKINWTVVIIIAVVLLFVASIFGGHGYGGWGMMSPRMMGGWVSRHLAGSEWHLCG
jgi:uncharacterized membrane protein